MIAVIQRVKYAKVSVNLESISQINSGLLILLSVTHNDTEDDIIWLTNKIVNLRIFDDSNGVMNVSCLENNANILTISQFTLHARTKKGNRPSYIDAAKPEFAKELYELFILNIDLLLHKKTFSGKFGANMQVELCNDGPVTIIIDTKNKL
jgi:D-tyrosyl-tRNA(Tyr) deacylase